VILDRLGNDQSNLVRFWAAQSFITSPDKRAVETLVAVYDHSQDAEVRSGCIEALATVGGDAAIVTLKKALNDESQLVRSTARSGLDWLLSRRN
jgi:HEAT repeat protein